MEHEMIDEYNKLGQKIGVVDKEIAHRDGLWHKAIHVWIVNDKDEVLLQYRCAEKKLYPNMWDTSFAGHIGTGESSIEAVIREGKEELGIDVDLDKLELLITSVEKVRFRKIVSNEFIDVYMLRQNVDLDKIVLQKEEVSNAKYVSMDEFFKIVEEEKICPHPVPYRVLKEVFKNPEGIGFPIIRAEVENN